MPRPNEGETKEDYVARFMKSAEAQSDFPDDKQRVAVAYSMWERRGKLKNSAGSPWAKFCHSNHLEPGLVFYQNMGPIDPATQKPKGLMLLLRKATIERMRNSFPGKPVYNKLHREDASPAHFKNGEADGIVVRSYWNAEAGQEYVEHMVWDEETKLACARGVGVSCAYEVDAKEVDMTPGTLHNVPYDGEILNGTYDHLTVTENPRYEDSKTTVLNTNDKGGVPMFKMILEKLGVKSSVDVAAETPVEIAAGKQVTLKNLVDKFNAPPPPEKVTALNAVADGSKVIELGNGKTATMEDLVKNYLKNEEKPKDEESDEEKEKKRMKNQADQIEAEVTKRLDDKIKAARLDLLANTRPTPEAAPAGAPIQTSADSAALGKKMFSM